MKPMLTLDQIPRPSENSTFSPKEIKTITLPHPYCVASRHVRVASDKFGGILGEEAIRYAEKGGAVCDICRKGGGEILSYEKHESMLTLFIKVPKTNDLNSIPGLNAYLLFLKEKNLGIDGFAFPSF